MDMATGNRILLGAERYGITIWRQGANNNILRITQSLQVHCFQSLK